MPLSCLGRSLPFALVFASWLCAAQESDIQQQSSISEPVDYSRHARFLIADEPGSLLNPIDAKMFTKWIAEVTRVDGETRVVWSYAGPKGSNGSHQPLLARPGLYIVKLACAGGGFSGEALLPMFRMRAFSQPVEVRAGYDYTFVCAGRAAGRLHVIVNAQPRSEAAADALVATRMAPTRPPTARPATLSTAPWVAANGGRATGIADHTLTIPAELSDHILMFLVKDALTGHQWAVTEEHATWMRGLLQYEDIRVVVDAVRDGATLKIVYVESQNLGYRKTSGGKARIANEYPAWVEFVLGDIAAILRAGGSWAGQTMGPPDAPWTPPDTTGHVGIPVQTLNLPTDLDETNVMAAVENALIEREWRVIDRHQHWLRAMLRLRGHLLIVDIVAEPGALKIVYRESSRLDYEVAKGKASIHRQYYNWTGYLLRDVAEDLGISPPAQ